MGQQSTSRVSAHNTLTIRNRAIVLMTSTVQPPGEEQEVMLFVLLFDIESEDYTSTLRSDVMPVKLGEWCV